jgi:hypothetical protein
MEHKAILQRKLDAFLEKSRERELEKKAKAAARAATAAGSK